MTTERMKVVFGHLQKSNAGIIPSMMETSAMSTPASQGHKFRYTLDSSLLSQNQRQFYEENGYLVIPKLIDDDLLEECTQRFIDVCEGTVPRANMTLMKEKSLAKTGAAGEYLYYKLQDVVWDDVLSKYILHDKLLDYVQCFTGPNIMAMHSMLINKPPDAGKNTSKHPLHQDLHYFPFRPADRIVAAWTAMERVTLDNGCLVVVPGSHKGTLLPHGYPDWENGVNKAFHGIQGYHPDSVLPLEMEKGDTVFFHPILIHGSGINITRGFRKAISCHYAASECEYIDVRGTTQENIAEEVVEMAKKKGVEINFLDAWKYRSRLARGEEIAL